MNAVKKLLLVLAISLAVALSAFGQSAEPAKTLVPVHLDASTGDITIGSKTYSGKNPGMHLVVLSRQPDDSHPDAPNLIQEATFTDPASANSFLHNALTNTPDALLIMNGVGNYGFALSAIFPAMEKFGAFSEPANTLPTPPFVLIGNGGRNPGQATQRTGSTRNMDGYLAEDANGNYTFYQPDYIRFDITLDGTITVGGKAYTVADSYKNAGCDGNNSFRVVVVDREDPKNTPPNRFANNSYCTGQNLDFDHMATDLKGVISDETRITFIGTYGKVIPPDWSFGADGDHRVVPIAQEFEALGGYFETAVYLTPNDTYSLVGAGGPPTGMPGARKRARESSSVYPAHPTGELHGVLARGNRNNWYGPINADPSGKANLGLYEILGQAPVAFPHPASNDELTAYQYFSQQLCGSPTCLRNQYSNDNIDITEYGNLINGMKGPNNVDCGDPANANTPFCIMKQQITTEFKYVADIRKLNENLNDVLVGSQGISILSLLSTYTNVKNTLPVPPPPSAPTPSLAASIVNVFLGLASYIPDVGPLFGVADVVLNAATSLTTDSKGNQLISISTTVEQLEQQAITQFTAQANTTGTQFALIYQDWGKINSLGQALSAAQPGWTWSQNATARILTSMTPAIEEAAYRNLLPAVYAIGRYVPQCFGFWADSDYYLDICKNQWNTSPQVYLQPRAYWFAYYTDSGCLCPAQPFNIVPLTGGYVPYTFPTDNLNPSNTDPASPSTTIIANTSWLGISTQTTPAGALLYNPPQASLLSHLFQPKSSDGTGGLGVYRPEFFESWPFPHLDCSRSEVTVDYGGGCVWSNAAPPPESLPAPVTRVSIRASKASRNGTLVTVPLIISNTGTLTAKTFEISRISLRTLAGSGEVTVVGPALPLRIDTLKPGSSTTINLQLSIPPFVTRLSITEEGTIDAGLPATLRFSQGQVLYPQTIK